MKIINLNFILTITLVNLLCSLSFVYGEEEDLKDYFPLSQDNKWIYKSSGEVTNIKIRGTQKIKERETFKLDYDFGSYDCINLDDDGVRLYRSIASNGSYEEYAPPLMIFPRFIINNKTFEEFCTYTCYNKKGEVEHSGSLTIKIEFAGRETLTIAKKQIDCIKIITTILNKAADGSSGKNKTTAWYARWIGKVKSLETETSYDESGKVTKTNNERAELHRWLINEFF